MSEMFVRPSVCLSVKRVNCDKAKETYANILTPQERSMHLVLRHEELLVENDHFYLNSPFKNGDFQSIFARSA